MYYRDVYRKTLVLEPETESHDSIRLTKKSRRSSHMRLCSVPLALKNLPVIERYRTGQKKLYRPLNRQNDYNRPKTNSCETQTSAGFAVFQCLKK